MGDLRFLIVNNHLPHSVAEKGKLDARVTFPVYQDTEERDIWHRMQGGKDDVFIYDRCGRLAYFIPFPLSIMNTEDALVPAAILATYFQSPCGATCEDTTPQQFNDTAELDFTTPLYPSDNSTLPNVDYPSDNSTLPDVDYPSDNSTLPDVDLNDSLEDETDVYGRIHNDLSFVLDANETVVDREANDTIVDDPSLVGSNRSNEIPVFASFSNETDGDNATVATTTTTTTTQAPRKKSDRCAEADMSVCRTWSKRKLLRAQTCCNNGVHSAALSESCRNYGKKRCKKIRTVLKCCLKTSYSEGHASSDDVKTEGHAFKVNTTGDSNAKVNATPDGVRAQVNASLDASRDDDANDVKTRGHASHVEEATSAHDVTIEVTTRVNYVVCCKEQGGQRTCRVSLEGACEAGETVSQDGPPLQTN